MSRTAVAVGIVLISFLVWLWRYTPENEVGAWLEDHGLKDLRHHGALEGLKSLRECTALDLDALRHDVGEKSYVRLKQAVLSLDLEFWLEDNGLKSIHSSLVKEGYATRKDLYRMTVEEAQEVSKHLLPPVQRDKFLVAVRELFEARDIPGLESDEDPEKERAGVGGTAQGSVSPQDSDWTCTPSPGYQCCYKDKNCTTYMAEEEFCCDYEALSFHGVNGVCTGC